MNDSELPAAAIEAGAAALHRAHVDGTYHHGQYAWPSTVVLVAATERIECPKCVVESGTDSSGESWVRQRAIICRVCAGSGVRFVLKTEKPT